MLSETLTFYNILQQKLCARHLPYIRCMGPNQVTCGRSHTSLIPKLFPRTKIQKLFFKTFFCHVASKKSWFKHGIGGSLNSLPKNQLMSESRRCQTPQEKVWVSENRRSPFPVNSVV